jgi:hypothetical protein
VKRVYDKLKASGLEKAEIDIGGLRLSPDGSCSVGMDVPWDGIKVPTN